MNIQAPPSPLDLALYPLRDAARLVQLDARTARRWALGYNYTYQNISWRSAGVMSVTDNPPAGDPDLTFAEMLTLRLVRGFREAKLGLRTIKRVAEVAAREFRTPTPFVSKRFRTDGRKVFVELQEKHLEDDEPATPPRERKMIEVLTGQHAFADVVEPSLFANVDWDDNMATRWWPLGHSRAVVLDPATVCGAPSIADTRVPTSAVAQAVRSEGGGDAAIDAVADWYGISPAKVRDGIDFETAWLKRAA
jgi:uncharacterized protein (DUF433 family)